MVLRIAYLFCLLAVFVPASHKGQVVTAPVHKGVYENDFCRNTFYTWTTAEQISQLRATKTLLTKSKSETKGYSIFDLSLRDSSLRDNKAVQLLLEEQFSKKRFAWVNSWATVMGWEGESYGNQLIKIVLKDSAIIGKFNRSNTAEPLGFYNMNGRKLTLDFVLKNKDRVAAVYHENTNKTHRLVLKRKGTYGKAQKIDMEDDVPYREFVVLNENMIKQWSYGTAVIKEEVKSEIKLLGEFQGSTLARKTAYEQWKNGWEETDATHPVETDLAKYYALSCFQNNYYLFNSKNMKAIIKQLQLALKQQTEEIIH